MFWKIRLLYILITLNLNFYANKTFVIYIIEVCIFNSLQRENSCLGNNWKAHNCWPTFSQLINSGIATLNSHKFCCLQYLLLTVKCVKVDRCKLWPSLLCYFNEQSSIQNALYCYVCTLSPKQKSQNCLQRFISHWFCSISMSFILFIYFCSKFL
jgi:hypothetical protein